MLTYMADKFPEVTDFSKRFGVALAAVMEARGVSQSAAARAIGKKAGASYISERVRGLRAVDTDVIAGVALVADVSPQTITREVLARMRGDEAGGTVTPLPTNPSGPGRRVRDTSKLVAKRSQEKAGAPEDEE